MTIWDAVIQEDLEFIEAYAKAGEDLNVGARIRGTTPLFHALEHRKKKSFSKLLQVGADPNVMCRGGKILVHYAAAQNDPFWLREVLDAGGDPNIMNDEEGLKKGRPLAYAATDNGDQRIANVEMLLDSGAEIDAAVDYRGRDTLRLACGSTDFEVVYLLLERGADYNRPASHEEESFISILQGMTPDVYVHDPHAHKWCKAVWDWLAERGVDPRKATWDESRKQWEFH